MYSCFISKWLSEKLTKLAALLFLALSNTLHMSIVNQVRRPHDEERGPLGFSLMTQHGKWWRARSCYHAVVRGCCSLLLSAALSSYLTCIVVTGAMFRTCHNSSTSCSDYYFLSYCSCVCSYVVVMSLIDDLLWKKRTHSESFICFFVFLVSINKSQDSNMQDY